MTTFAQFRDVIARFEPTDFCAGASAKPELLITERSDLKVRTYYAPFDHINRDAKLVLVGITPGRTQMNNALKACCSALRRGESDEAAVCVAKKAASFSGSMQKILVALLERYDFHKRFGLKSAYDLWSPDNQVAHFTSALRNPVFALKGVDEKDYTGSTPVLHAYKGFRPALAELREELMAIKDGLIVPLGDKVTRVIQTLVDAGDIPLERVLRHDGLVAEFPHPSGANGETHNLALLPSLGAREEYASQMLKDYRLRKQEEQEVVTAKREASYLSARCSYYDRAVISRAAMTLIQA